MAQPFSVRWFGAEGLFVIKVKVRAQGRTPNGAARSAGCVQYRAGCEAAEQNRLEPTVN
jgi:hypothetical protein